jgi:hypothetical protein
MKYIVKNRRWICQSNSLCCDMFMLYYICQSNSLCYNMFMLYCICQSNNFCFDMFILYCICQSNTFCCNMFILYCICQSRGLLKCMKEISFCHSQHSTITTLTLAKYKLEQLQEIESQNIIIKTIKKLYINLFYI